MKPVQATHTDGAQRPIVVTGATGFLGGHLVRTLRAQGRPVRALGRNLRAGLALQEAGADFRPVDLRDRPGMITACEGASAIVHSGALSSAWGKYKDFYDINVHGTENAIAACREHGIPKLIYISSPSVMTRPEPQYNLTESEPLPDDFVSMYSETKKLGEDRIRDAQAQGMATVILRPKAIYGPGDNAIFPRLIEAAAKNRLPIIGDGETITNLTHVSDVVQSILLALENDAVVGKTYVITGGEDVKIWDVITEVVTRLGHNAPTKRIALNRAMAIARGMEAAWRVLRLPGEPLLTTYKVGILGMSQTYDISAARSELGYEPKMLIREGIEDTLRALQEGDAVGEKPPRPSPAAAGLDEGPASNGAPRLPVTVCKAGSCTAREKFFLPGGAWRTIDIPAMFALIDHPEQGTIVFDTGYSPRFFEGTREFPFKIMAYTTPTTVTDEDTAVAHVRRLGRDPEDVRWLVLSHFDPDHYGGLKDFPNARIICSHRAWAAVAGKSDLAAMKVRLLPGHLPEDMAARVLVLPDPDGPPIGVFPASLDIFGDSSIRLVELPGHATGQMGAFVTRSDGTEMFLAADSCWNMASLENDSYGGGLHRWIAADRRGQDATYATMRRLRRQWPSLLIVPTHCPRVWRELSTAQQGETNE